MTLALAGGSFIFLAVIVVILIGVVIGYYTRRGSDIGEHPSSGSGSGGGEQAPGADSSGAASGKTAGEHDAFDTRGTR